MTRLELIRILSSKTEEDVMVKIGDTAYEIKGIGHLDESFDGFDTVYPDAVLLNLKEE